MKERPRSAGGQPAALRVPNLRGPIKAISRAPGFGALSAFVMVVHTVCRIAAIALMALLPASRSLAAPENIALTARASATSEHNGQYLARFAIDGRIPGAGGQDDPGKAWCVVGDTHRDGAVFTLEWAQPVTIAEVVYYGRTAWFAEECWKDYELYLDGASAAAAKGRFEMGHGPQRIRLASPDSARKLTLKFVRSYGGLNPGASEIQVFSTPLSARDLPAFHKLGPGRPQEINDDEIPESADLARAVADGRFGFTKLLVARRREINPSHVYTYHVEGFSAGGGLYELDLRGATAGDAAPALKELVASPDGQILDCDLSFDGREILLSWRRKKTDGYHLFVINSDGSNLRQLTSGPHHNYNACWLPDGGIAFLSTREARFAYCWVSPVGVLHRMERDGSNVQRLSANIVNDFTPSVLNDGRIIYSRWEYVDKPAIPIQSLWTIHPDGTSLAGYFGNRILSPATFMEARSIPGDTRVLCTLTSHNGPARGAIGIIDIANGNNAQAGIQNLTPWVNIGRAGHGDGNNIRGPYENPFPVDERFFLVSRRGTVLLRDYAGTQSATLASAADGLGFYNPTPLRTRVAPAVLAPRIHLQFSTSEADRNARFGHGSFPLNPALPMDRSATVPKASRNAFPSAAAGLRHSRAPVQQDLFPASDSRVEWATVVLQDVYRGLEPLVKRGDVKQICVVEEMKKEVRTDVANRAFGFQFPVISCGATYACKKVWGYAPVAADGSAAFEVPAGRPIYFMALDAQGRAVQRMRTFTHLMRGEVQGCVGCHEPRSQTGASGGRALLTRQPDKLTPPEWGDAVGFDYTRIVQPILDKHCASCHSGPAPDGKVDLSGDKTDFFNVSYDVLARGRKRSGESEWDSPYVNWIPTFNGMEQNILEVTPLAWGSPQSKLADLLLTGHADAAGKARLKMEAHEIRRILAWIDLNVPYYGTSETAYPNNKGCRQLYPGELDKVLSGVAARRCASCHKDGAVPRPVWTRITNPQLNNFLVAPLSRSAGGTEACGKAVFDDTNDPDYVALLATFEPVKQTLAKRPRMDMAGAKPADVDRSCLGGLE